MRRRPPSGDAQVTPCRKVVWATNTNAGKPTMPPRLSAASVATMLHPSERSSVDAAGEGVYETLHRDSLSEVLRDLKERRIRAVVVSAARCDSAERGRIATVVREFPRIPAVAILSDVEPTSASAVLALGNCGVKTLVDVRSPRGWHQLRALLSAEATTDIDRAILALLRSDLEGAAEDCWRFFEVIFSTDGRVATVRQLSGRLGVLPSTLTSRFFRAHLPAPKRYLAFARLIRAARLFENPGFSVSDVSNHLDYSSPQSFGRHVRTMFRITAGEFRRSYDGDGMINRFRNELVLPNLEKLEKLHPLDVRPAKRRLKA